VTGSPREDRSSNESGGRHALQVAAGILISRLVGLVRQGVFAKYFGLSDPGDAFTAAFRVPNLLQNLFGEGVLSASFIPVYAKLLALEDDDESDRVAGAVGAILALVASIVVLIGIAVTPYLIFAIAPGFEGEKRELTIRLVRVLFPGAGLLVLSAWCLGILNSHRKFFLSYTAPVIWNVAMIATMFWYRDLDQGGLALRLAWASVIGSALQFAVQLPTVLRLVSRLRPRLDVASAHVREVLRNFGPVFISRGVVQISAYVDQMLGSLLGEGAVTALTNVQSMYTLPVSLFGMSISAAELPAMSSALGDSAEVAATLRQRLTSGLRRIAFLVVPSAMAFFVLGDVITAVLYERGEFTHADTTYVWGILAGSAIGLLASTLARLYASTYYALRDTRTPLRYATLRVVLTTVLGYLCAIWVPRWLDIDPHWGAAGLTASAGFAGWVEFALLRRTMNARIGDTGVPAAMLAKLWISAAIGAAAGWALKPLVAGFSHYVVAAVVLGAYGMTYFAATFAMRVPECATMVRRILTRLGLSATSNTPRN
jgi:putative peptidoglycan lipid II flippase